MELCRSVAKIGGCYIPPPDSIYFDLSIFAKLHEECSDFSMNRVIMGDLNGRCGKALCDLNTEEYKYLRESLPDPVQNPLSNGKELLNLCKDTELLVLNNLIFNGDSSRFSSKCTYKKGSRWISELDLCLVNCEVLPAIDYLKICEESLPSDHVPVTIRIDLEKFASERLPEVLDSACKLGAHAVLQTNIRQNMCKKPIQVVDNFSLAQKLSDLSMTTAPTPHDVARTLYDAAKVCRLDRGEGQCEGFTITQEKDRWRRLLCINDSKQLWNAINWKGELGTKRVNSPSDEVFKSHFENLLNPGKCEYAEMPLTYRDISVPILDDPITPEEVQGVIDRQLKPNKGCGPDGLSPRLFAILPVQWILILTHLFNIVFNSLYPEEWRFAKIITLFKKGDTSECGNYRGISVMNSIPKIYDYILCNRLSKWFIPDREQAGAQPKRGCLEHIISLRLLIEYAIMKRKKLFIVFVDFSAAYDRVPRNALVVLLAALGCGTVMLAALASMYRVSYGIIGVSIVTCTIGVRQGSPTSCFLFTLYVNPLIRKLKEQCVFDDYLKWLHVLMLMDDTAILATTRKTCVEKVKILLDFCTVSGMKINESKTKFMVINRKGDDRQDILVTDKGQSLRISSCEEYNYLGCWFTQDGGLSAAIKKHVRDKYKHFVKLISFLSKNRDFPFSVKKKVVDSAFLTAILYGCESWFSKYHVVNSLYISAVKNLLGVRQSTPNSLCLIELGYPPLKDYVLNKQKLFFQKAVTERVSVKVYDPLMFVIRLVSDTSMGNYIDGLLTDSSISHEKALQNMRNNILTSVKTKFVTYTRLNPSLTVHDVYKPCVNYIPEVERVSFTRFRLSSHKLRIETGRWSRIPRDLRICECGKGIQDEQHVIKDCLFTEAVRNKNDGLCLQLPEFFDGDNNLVCRFVYEVLQNYE